MRWCDRRSGYQRDSNERCDDSKTPVKSAEMTFVAAISAMTAVTISSLGKPRGSSYEKRRT